MHHPGNIAKRYSPLVYVTLEEHQQTMNYDSMCLAASLVEFSFPIILQILVKPFDQLLNFLHLIFV